MKHIIDKKKFGPWAVVTGASSGIGKEFAQQLAASGLDLVLVSRRSHLLDEIGQQLTSKYGMRYRVVEADLAEESAIQKIADATHDLDIGLLISNAGTGRPGKFLSFKEEDLKRIIQLNAISSLRLTYYFGKRLAGRGKGAILLTSAMGASDGIPYMANEAGTKALIASLGKGLHAEFKQLGVNLTVLITPPTDTPILYRLGFTKDNLPMKPISVQQCVSEALRALMANKSSILPGRKYRLMNTLVPAAIARKMMGTMMKKNNSIE